MTLLRSGNKQIPETVILTQTCLSHEVAHRFAVVYKSLQNSSVFRNSDCLTINQKIIDTEFQSQLRERAVDTCSRYGFTEDPFHGRENAFDRPS